MGKKRKRRGPKVKFPTNAFCVRCGAKEPKFNWQIRGRMKVPEKCSSCGGTLVRQKELPPDIRRKIGDAARTK